MDDYQATSGADAPPGEKEYQRNRDEKPQTAGVHNQHKVDSPFDRQDAFVLVANDAGLRAPEQALLRRTVLGRYGRTLDLAEIG